MANEHPSVTVAIPVLNEAGHIERVLKQFQQSSYPYLREILVADGGSADGTRDIVRRVAKTDKRVRLLDSPKRVQSAALNRMLEIARGDVFLRADAHCFYASDYVEACVSALLNSQALNVGGAQRFVAVTPFQAGIVLASKSPLGNGGAKYRDPNYDGYAETVYIGCYWRNAVIDLGRFDEDAVTNEDAELNLRLLKKQDKAIYISSCIQVWYLPRDSFLSLLRQYFKYGRGRSRTASKHPSKSFNRSKLLFYVLLVLSLIVLWGSLFYSILLSLITIISALLFALIESTRIALKTNPYFANTFWMSNCRRVPNLITRMLFCWSALVGMPLAHFAGQLYQMVRNKLLGISSW